MAPIIFKSIARQIIINFSIIVYLDLLFLTSPLRELGHKRI